LNPEPDKKPEKKGKKKKQNAYIKKKKTKNDKIHLSHPLRWEGPSKRLRTKRKSPSLRIILNRKKRMEGKRGEIYDDAPIEKEPMKTIFEETVARGIKKKKGRLRKWKEKNHRGNILIKKKGVEKKAEKARSPQKIFQGQWVSILFQRKKCLAQISERKERRKRRKRKIKKGKGIARRYCLNMQRQPANSSGIQFAGKTNARENGPLDRTLT